MTVHDQLKADHQIIRERIAEIKQALTKNPAQLAKLFPALQATIRAHLRKEDDVYFHVLDDGKRISNRELMHDLRNDHAAVVFSLESLAIKLRNGLPVPEWKKKFEAMTAVLLPHLDHEEKELFEKAEKLLTAPEFKTIQDEIQKLG